MTKCRICDICKKHCPDGIWTIESHRINIDLSYFDVCHSCYKEIKAFMKELKRKVRL